MLCTVSTFSSEDVTTLSVRLQDLVEFGPGRSTRGATLMQNGIKNCNNEGGCAGVLYRVLVSLVT